MKKISQDSASAETLDEDDWWDETFGKSLGGIKLSGKVKGG